MICNFEISTLKINQLACIQDLFEYKNLSNCNFVNISIKARTVVKIYDTNNYKKADIKAYKLIIKKLIYQLYSTRPNVDFTIKQLSKHNSDFKLRYLKTSTK